MYYCIYAVHIIFWYTIVVMYTYFSILYTHIDIYIEINYMIQYIYSNIHDFSISTPVLRGVDPDPTSGGVVNASACFAAYDACNLMAIMPYELTGASGMGIPNHFQEFWKTLEVFPHPQNERIFTNTNCWKRFGYIPGICWKNPGALVWDNISFSNLEPKLEVLLIHIPLDHPWSTQRFIRSIPGLYRGRVGKSRLHFDTFWQGIPTYSYFSIYREVPWFYHSVPDVAFFIIIPPGKNPYDMRILCKYGRLCYDFDMIGTYLNKPEVQTEWPGRKDFRICHANQHCKSEKGLLGFKHPLKHVRIHGSQN